MFISIITPVLNGEKTISRTLRSLQDQKADFEHIVQDGGSVDGTHRIVERFQSDYPVSLHCEKDKGIYDAVLKGFAKSKGDIMAWINADDFYLPWTLATVQAVFTKYPEVEWITGIPSHFYDESGISMVAPYAPVYLQACLKRGLYTSHKLGFVQQESMFWRRSLWEKCNAEETLAHYRLAGDFHLWKGFAQHAPLRTVSTVLAAFTLSGTQATAKFQQQYLQECGVRAKSMHTPKIGLLFNRMMAAMFFKKVIKLQNS